MTTFAEIAAAASALSAADKERLIAHLQAQPTENVPGRGRRLKSLDVPPLEGLPSDLSVGIRERIRDAVKHTNATHR